MPRLRHNFAVALAALVLLLAMAPSAPAQDPGPGRGPGRDNAEHHPQSPGEPALPAEVATNHSIKFGTHELAYTATAGTLTLTDGKGEHIGEVFYVAYTMKDADPKTRPITILFNGGPGAGSAYLQLGAIGPRVLDFGNGREAPFTSGTVIDNPDTWLDATDLIFIDPIGCGYSRGIGAPDEIQKNFWGVHPDLASMGQIIRLALGKFDRFGSPLYLAGESYGGFRAARLPKQLAQTQGLVVRGAVLISPALELSLLSDDDILAPMPWALHIPSYAAVALEEKGQLTPEALVPAEKFALGDYVHNLVVMPTDPKEADRFYSEVAQFIGLPETLVARWKGRIPMQVFVKEKHHDEGELLSRYDGSVETHDPYPWSGWPNTGDPILAGLTAPLTNGYVAYLRDELHYKTDRRYILLNFNVNEHWNMHERDNNGGALGGAADDLAEGLALDPRLHVLIAHGMTDLQTPYLSSRYVIDHVRPELTQGRVALKLYPGGHMMYLRPASRAALHKDVRQTIYGAE